MQQTSASRAFLPLTIIFVITSTLFITLYSLLERWKMDPIVLFAGNVILFGATAISFYLYSKAIRNNNVQAFLRMVYGGMFAKMMICLIAAVIYISAAGKATSKNAIFGCMFLYFLYTFTEVAILMKLSKQNKNA
jgi:hypothetical protein